MKADGISFAILRCRSYQSDGTWVIDPTSVANVQGAPAQGIQLGVYI